MKFDNSKLKVGDIIEFIPLNDRIQKIYDKISINSFHHQAIKNLAPGFKISASAPDGIIEAIEKEDDSQFIAAVQWHPEAYNNDGIENSAQNRSLVTYMVKAGDAFCAKRLMLDSFGDEFEDVLSRLKAIKL